MSSDPLTPAQRSNFFPLTAWGYSWWRARSLSLLSGEAFALEREARLFLNLCQPQRGEHWLDAGTSAGFYAGVLASAGCRVDAVDLSPAMLRVAQQEQTSPLIRYYAANIETWMGPAQPYDGVTVGATLNETARPEVFLHRLEEHLRPGGQLWLMWAAPSGGTLQRGLGRLGGLSFPDLTWVKRRLGGCELRAGLRVGGVQFARFVKM